MKLARPKECTACMACIDGCTKKALRAEVNKNGYFVIVEEEEKCINCGLCTQICPIINPINTDNCKSEPYAAWNTDLNQREKSASGGVFAALATIILKKGGVVYGAIIDGFDVMHKRIDNIKDLPSIQGSKYQQSQMNGIYKQVKKDLIDNKVVLFSGLGCQIAGLISFLGKIERGNLYTVDMICGGLSTMLPMLQLKNSGKYNGIKSFRDKENGWQSNGFKYSLKMIGKDGKIENLGADNLALTTFSSRLLKRSSCLDCKFTGFHRNSDCTIGDFWGIEKFREQHKDGISVLIVHNNRIKSLLKNIAIDMKNVLWSDIIRMNSNICWTKYPLIRYFPGRFFVLNRIRNQKTELVKTIMNYKSYLSLGMRIYMLFNKKSKEKYLKNFD